MNNLIYGAIGFLLGGMLGGAIVGNIIAKDCKKQLDEMEERTKLIIDENEKLKSSQYKKREEKIEKKDKKIEKDLESLRKSYAKAIEDDDEEEDLEIFEAPIVESEKAQEEEKTEKPIRLISEQRFMEDINYRDSESMTYYQGDGTLVDSANDVVSAEETIIGEDAMEIIDDTKNDFLYVLNEDLDKLYEISIEHNTEYFRDILGVG